MTEHVPRVHKRLPGPWQWLYPLCDKILYRRSISEAEWRLLGQAQATIDQLALPRAEHRTTRTYRSAVPEKEIP